MDREGVCCEIDNADLRRASDLLDPPGGPCNYGAHWTGCLLEPWGT